jgi:hypothetical protein
MRSRLLSVAAVVFAMLPFAFALVRMVQAAGDVRALWMAIVGVIGAFGVLVIAKPRPATVLILTFVAVTLLAGVTVTAFGARGVGGWMVAAGFAMFDAIAAALYTTMRQD